MKSWSHGVRVGNSVESLAPSYKVYSSTWWHTTQVGVASASPQTKIPQASMNLILGKIK